MSNVNVRRPLPKPLERLADLALDLRLIGSKTMSQIWRRLDAEAWSRCNNPYMILQNARQKVLDEAAADEVLIRELQRWLQRQDQYMKSPGWFGTEHAKSELRAIAYFSMEFGLAEALPIYSGGLQNSPLRFRYLLLCKPLCYNGLCHSCGVIRQSGT